MALLENGQGPLIMIRADMDPLPVREETGLSYQSRIKTTDLKGGGGGDTCLRRMKPLTGSEDFGLFPTSVPSVPVCYFRLRCDDGRGSCGFLHSSRFCPDPRLIRAAISALVVVAADCWTNPR
jgi:metal-dependent amidase/aminoacylase/carboxypeptidase family protein